MLTDKDYTDPEQIQEGKTETVKASIQAVDVTGERLTKEVTLVYDKTQVDSADVLQDLDKEIEQEFTEEELTYQFDEKLFTDKIVCFQVKRERTETEDRTSTKLFTKSYYKELEEKKYEEPELKAKQIIEEADEDDRLQLKIRAKGKPKVLEATRIQDKEDLIKAMDATEPYDSEKLE